jgi:hypothetical protein
MMEEARNDREERYDVQVNVTHRGGAQVLVKDRLAGYSEVFCFSPREIELMLLAASDNIGLVSRLLADYTLKTLFMPRAEIMPGSFRKGPEGSRPGTAHGAPESSPRGFIESRPGRQERPHEGKLSEQMISSPMGEAGSAPGENCNDLLQGPPQIRVESRIETLERELTVALRLEDYESASRLRDEIAELKKDNSL